MKRFRDFIKKKEHRGFVPSAPVHFKHVNDVVAKNLREDEEHEHPDVKDWALHNDNHHIGKERHEIEKTSAGAYQQPIRDHLREHAPKLNTEERHHVISYTDYSTGLNQDLIAHHKAHAPDSTASKHHKLDTAMIMREHSERVRHLDSATRHPIGHELHVYSGVGFHPGEATKNHGGFIHLPAYTSATHTKTIAHSFAAHHIPPSAGEHHVIHIHLQPHDRALHVSHISSSPSENETMLPRGTTLKIHHKPDVYHDYERNSKVHVWHATVHHQIDHEDDE